jgi:hypothetical protein
MTTVAQKTIFITGNFLLEIDRNISTALILPVSKDTSVSSVSYYVLHG